MSRSGSYGQGFISDIVSEDVRELLLQGRDEIRLRCLGSPIRAVVPCSGWSHQQVVDRHAVGKRRPQVLHVLDEVVGRDFETWTCKSWRLRRFGTVGLIAQSSHHNIGCHLIPLTGISRPRQCRCRGRASAWKPWRSGSVLHWEVLQILGQLPLRVLYVPALPHEGVFQVRLRPLLELRWSGSSFLE